MGSVNDFVLVSRASRPSLEGVIAYTGPVAFADGDDWVGVRLTGASVGLGKNDGSVSGVHYFACPPNCGIFVRRTALSPRKMTRTEELKLRREMGLPTTAATPATPRLTQWSPTMNTPSPRARSSPHGTTPTPTIGTTDTAGSPVVSLRDNTNTPIATTTETTPDRPNAASSPAAASLEKAAQLRARLLALQSSSSSPRQASVDDPESSFLLTPPRVVSRAGAPPPTPDDSLTHGLQPHEQGEDSDKEQRAAIIQPYSNQGSTSATPSTPLSLACKDGRTPSGEMDSSKQQIHCTRTKVTPKVLTATSNLSPATKRRLLRMRMAKSPPPGSKILAILAASSSTDSKDSQFDKVEAARRGRPLLPSSPTTPITPRTTESHISSRIPPHSPSAPGTPIAKMAREFLAAKALASREVAAAALSVSSAESCKKSDEPDGNGRSKADCIDERIEAATSVSRTDTIQSSTPEAEGTSTTKEGEFQENLMAKPETRKVLTIDTTEMDHLDDASDTPPTTASSPEHGSTDQNDLVDNEEPDGGDLDLKDKNPANEMTAPPTATTITTASSNSMEPTCSTPSQQGAGSRIVHSYEKPTATSVARVEKRASSVPRCATLTGSGKSNSNMTRINGSASSNNKSPLAYTTRTKSPSPVRACASPRTSESSSFPSRIPPSPKRTPVAARTPPPPRVANLARNNSLPNLRRASPSPSRNTIGNNSKSNNSTMGNGKNTPRTPTLVERLQNELKIVREQLKERQVENRLLQSKLTKAHQEATATKAKLERALGEIEALKKVVYRDQRMDQPSFIPSSCRIVR